MKKINKQFTTLLLTVSVCGSLFARSYQKKPEPLKPAPVKPVPVKPEPVKPVPVKPVPVKPVPAKPVPAKPVPVKPIPVPPKPHRGHYVNMHGELKLKKVRGERVFILETNRGDFILYPDEEVRYPLTFKDFLRYENEHVEVEGYEGHYDEIYVTDIHRAPRPKIKAVPVEPIQPSKQYKLTD